MHIISIDSYYNSFIYLSITLAILIVYSLWVHFLGGNLSHQLSTCSAVSLPSKIDSIGSDNELEDADDPEFDINGGYDDDYDDGFTAYDDDEYDSEGDSRSRSAADVLNDDLENNKLYDSTYSNGNTSPSRKLGHR